MWRALSSKSQDIAVNIGTAIAGTVLALSPWLLDFTLIWAMWSAFLLGGAIVLLAVRSLIVEEDWEAFAKMALGLWAAISPAMLGFTHATDAALAHLLLGGATTGLSAFGMWFRDPPPSATSVR